MCWRFSYTIIIVLSRVSAATDQSHCLDIQLALANKLANAFKNYQYQTNTSNLNLANSKPDVIVYLLYFIYFYRLIKERLECFPFVPEF